MHLMCVIFRAAISKVPIPEPKVQDVAQEVYAAAEVF